MAQWRVPGYTELRVLGSGGFGDVVAARNEAAGNLVAIKYLHAELRADPLFAGMFRSEARALAGLDDPNIVRLHEYVESPSGAAIVMELVDGVSLREVLARYGATGPEAALVVLHGSLMGLAAAHRQGVVHRDYKPENILIDGQGASKLTDFGLAARSGDRPLPAGTLAYAAPEQLDGEPATPACDVYAATVTFYECVTGQRPFTGDAAELARQNRTETAASDLVPEALRPLVAAGMAKDPASRPSDAASLARQLEAAATGAYGPGWDDRGRSHLGEAALLLAALWPSAGTAASQSIAVQHIPTSHEPLPHTAPPHPAPPHATPRHIQPPRAATPPHTATPSHAPRLLRRILSMLRHLGVVKAVVITGAAIIIVTTSVVIVVKTAKPSGTSAAGPEIAYVTSSANSTVTPIYLATGKAGTPIRVGSGPDAIAITPDGKTAYVTNGSDNTVTPIHLATGTAGTPIKVGEEPYAIAITPDGKTAYVTNNLGNTVTPIHLATGTPGRPIQVGAVPAAIVITPDGKTAYVMGGGGEGNGMVTPVHLATGALGKATAVGEGYFAIAITRRP